jgi:hypothetical protein
MKKSIATLFFALAFLFTAIALAQFSGGDFEITRSTLDNGGGVSTGGEFSLTGTIGQADASSRPSSGGGFSLAGGFWAKVTDVIFRDGFEGG